MFIEILILIKAVCVFSFKKSNSSITVIIKQHYPDFENEPTVFNTFWSVFPCMFLYHEFIILILDFPNSDLSP